MQSTDNTIAHNLGLYLKVGFPSSHPQFGRSFSKCRVKVNQHPGAHHYPSIHPSIHRKHEVIGWWAPGCLLAGWMDGWMDGGLLAACGVSGWMLDGWWSPCCLLSEWMDVGWMLDGCWSPCCLLSEWMDAGWMVVSLLLVE